MEKKEMTISEINEILGTNYADKERVLEDINRPYWCVISKHKILSEDFIREFKDEVNWVYISAYQKLCEGFIREFKDRLNWVDVSKYQKLSEGFIREFKDRVNWDHISMFQKLSEPFIKEFKDRVNWSCISKFQKLSESFIREFQDKVDWYDISSRQKLSPEFKKEFKDKLSFYLIYEDNWIYKSTEFKKKAVMDTGLYECYDDYFIAYKGIRRDRYSSYNFQYQYLKGETYEAWCDCSDEQNSFGLSAWTKKEAKYYCDELVVKVKVRYEDVGRVVHEGGKIRCFKIEILD